MPHNALLNALVRLRGNPRAVVYTQPLWGIPNGLYAPFAAVYMSALALTDAQIGLVASASLAFQAVAALFSGAITDKLGRRWTTFIFDTLAYTVPCLLWAFSRNFWWFMVAAAFNGMLQIVSNSWTCLLVEDADPGILVYIFSFIHIASQLAVVGAPFAALLVDNLTIIPAMRIIYLFSFVSMTTKFIILLFVGKETKMGVIRKRETKGVSIFKIISGYGKILRRILASPEMVLSLSLSALFTVTMMVMANFFGLYATHNLGIAQKWLAYFPIVRAVVAISFLFFFQTKINRFGYRGPMLVGVAVYIASHAILIFSPHGAVWALMIYIFLEACAHCLVIPRRDSIAALLIDPEERAGIRGVMMVLIFGVSIPFGYFAGFLSDIDRRLPFLLDVLVFAAAFAVIYASKNLLSRRDAA